MTTGKLGQVVQKFPKLFLIIPILLTLLIAAGIPKLSFNVDYRVFFADDNPQLTAFNAIQDNYSASEKLLLVYTPSYGDAFHPTAVNAIQQATELLWQTPFSTRVDSLSNFQRTQAVEDDLLVEDLLPEGIAANELDNAKHYALNEPLLINRLLSEDGRVTGLLVTIDKPGNSPKEAASIVAHGKQVKELILSIDPDARVDLTGMIMMSNTFSESARADMKTLVPLMLLLVVLGLRFFLKSWKATLGISIVVLLSIAGGMGAGGWVGVELSSPSSAAPIIILTIAVAHGVHIANTHLRLAFENKANPEGVRTSAIKALNENLRPMLIAGVTTLAGFITMNFSDVPPYHDLGNLVSVGVTLATLLSVTFLPAFLMLTKATPTTVPTINRWVIPPLTHLLKQHTVAVLIVVGFGAIVLTAFIGRSELNDEFVKYFDNSTEFRQATDYTNQNLTGIYTIEYSISRGDIDAASDPRLLAELDQFKQWLVAQKAVRHVASISDTFKQINQNMNAGHADQYQLPKDRELSSQYLLMYEMSLPFGLDMSDRLTMDRKATRLVVTLNNISSNEMIVLEKQIAMHIQQRFPHWQVTHSSPMLMFAHIGEKNIKSMIFGVLAALMLVSVALGFLLRSAGFGLLSLLPNLVPILAVFGLWGIMVGELGLSMAMVGGMCLGLVVDDTVHLLSRYQKNRQRQLPQNDAIHDTLAHSGAPIIITSLILSCGFLLLGTSSFKLNSDLGTATGLIILAALVFDLLAIPAWLMWLAGRRESDYDPYKQINSTSSVQSFPQAQTGFVSVDVSSTPKNERKEQ